MALCMEAFADTLPIVCNGFNEVYEHHSVRQEGCIFILCQGKYYFNSNLVNTNTNMALFLQPNKICTIQKNRKEAKKQSVNTFASLLTEQMVLQ